MSPSDNKSQLSMLKEFVQIVGVKINYSKLFEKVSSNDNKCRLIRRILYMKGLRGEPTAAKCRQLRAEIQARKESAELDKSVIIRTKGKNSYCWTFRVDHSQFKISSISLNRTNNTSIDTRRCQLAERLHDSSTGDNSNSCKNQKCRRFRLNEFRGNNGNSLLNVEITHNVQTQLKIVLGREINVFCFPSTLCVCRTLSSNRLR